MCGFVFAMNCQQKAVDKALITSMNAKIIHRGPDQEGYYFKDNVGLGFRRLSILDLSESGQQPMISDTEKYVIIFNGEIYNYIEIREELKSLGYSFRSETDTEVLLKAYIEWGEECLSKLNGMWAFLIYDNVNKNVFGSRDRFGVKPLYVCKAGEHLLLASEIKCIRDLSLFRQGVNYESVAKFFVYGRLNNSQDTFYESIEEIPPGTKFSIDRLGNVSTAVYWQIETQNPRYNDPDFADKYFRLFEDSVKLRLRADVPVGVLLSGGLDSTAIICSMARNWPEHTPGDHLLHAFSFLDKEFDETEYVTETIKQTGAKLHVFNRSPNELYDMLTDVLWYHDEPLHSMTALVGFSLMRSAKEHGIKVLLNGQGADEVVAGYPSYRQNYWLTLLNKFQLRKWVSEIRQYGKFHDLDALSLLRNSVSKTAATHLNTFKWYNRMRGQKSPQVDPWLSSDLYTHLKPAVPRNDQTLQARLYDSVYNAPLPLYLRIEDRNSMANSIEARLPFLDYRLVQYSFDLDDSLKINGPWNKFVLREAMRSKIPESVRTRVEKMGFPTPTKRWITGPLMHIVNDIVHSRRFRERGLYNVSQIDRDLKSPEHIPATRIPMLFDILQYELWVESCSK